MNKQTFIESLFNEFRDIKGEIKKLKSLVQEQDDNILGGWIKEERVMKLTGLSKSSLYRLRKSGVIGSSFIVGKGIMYQIKDIIALLKENHKKK